MISCFNINYYFAAYSGEHLAVARSYYVPCIQSVHNSSDLDITDFFLSLLRGSFNLDGIIAFRDFDSLNEFVVSLENFCILDFSRAYALTDFELLNIELFLVQLTSSAAFLRDNF